MSGRDATNSSYRRQGIEGPSKATIKGAARFVPLDLALATHICEFHVKLLQDQLHYCGCTLSMVASGILLEWSYSDVSSSDVEKALQCIQKFSMQFSSLVWALPGHKSKELDHFTEVLRGLSLTPTGLGKCSFGLLFKIVGKVDDIKRLSNEEFGSVDIQELSIGGFDFLQGSLRSPEMHVSTSEQVSLHTADWLFLRLVSYETSAASKYSQVVVHFIEPGRMLFRGPRQDVKEAIKDLYHCLDCRKSITYYKSRLVISCIEQDWCKVLLQKKWEESQVKAVVKVTEEKTAVLYCNNAQELSKAMDVLETTVIEGQPVAYKKETTALMSKSTWSQIEDIVRGKAVTAIDEERKVIRVAGKADELKAIVNLLRAVAGSEAACSTLVAASSSQMQLIGRHYTGAVSSAATLGMPTSGNTRFLMELDASGFILRGEPESVKHAKNLLRRLLGQVQSKQLELRIPSGEWDSLLKQITFIEDQTRTLIVVQDPQSLRTTSTVQAASGTPQESGAAESSVGGHNQFQHSGSQDRVQLCILQGSVADQEADVLVNSVNINLDLASGAISSALFKKAGSEMQREIRQYYPRGIQEFGIAITSGCKLSCRNVFHVACREYTSPASLENLFDVIYRCLIQANDMGMTSITFPVIGIGQLGYQVRDVAGVFRRAVSFFGNKVSSGRLNKISCIAFDRDTYKVFRSLNPEPNSSAVARQYGSRTGKSRAASTGLSNASGEEVLLDQLRLQIVTGNIADSDTNIIVHSSDCSFSLRDKISMDLLKSADALKKELTALGKKMNFRFNYLMAENSLSNGSKLILINASTLQTGEAGIVFKMVLYDADFSGCQSISFSSLADDERHAKVIAPMLVEAVVQFSKDRQSMGQLRLVRLVANNEGVRSVLRNALLKAFPGTGSWLSSVTDYFGFTTPPVIRQELLPLQDCVHATVCGISEADISAACNSLRTMDGFEFVHEDDVHGEVKCREGDAKYSSVDINDGNVSQKNTNKQKDLSGGTRGASNEHQMSMVNENELRRSSTLSDVGRQREIHVGPAEPSACTAQSVFSAERQPSTDLHYGTSGSSYPGIVDSRTAPSWINHPSDDTGIIERMQRLKESSKEQLYPTNWQILESESIKCVVLDSYHEEYKQVILSFQRDQKYQPAKFLKVNQVIRIQDKTLWQQYAAQKEKIKRNCPENYEQKLWCCCSAEDGEALLKSRTPPSLFNRSSSSYNTYGCGSCFFRDPLKAVNASGSMLSGSGPRDEYIVQATVLTGHYILGNSSMRTLPQRSDSDSKYDSSVNDMMDPTVFVVYHDAQAYPLYVVKLA